MGYAENVAKTITAMHSFNTVCPHCSSNRVKYYAEIFITHTDFECKGCGYEWSRDIPKSE